MTVPSCYYLWPSTSHAEHSHATSHSTEEHEETAEKEDDDAEEAAPSEGAGENQEHDDSKPGEEPESPEVVQKKADETAEEQSKESEESAKPSGSEGESQPASDDANKSSHGGEEAEVKETPEGKGDVEGVQFKGKTAAGDDENKMDDTRKREPDSKGAFKKRIDSGAAKDLGTGSEEGGSESASSKEAKKGSEGDISGKQFGLSNTPTRHSTQIDEDPEKSKKGEGSPETAKSMGTVQVDRPAVSLH